MGAKIIKPSKSGAKAEEGTIRKLFAESIQANAVHGSDSDQNAEWEANFFFSLRERFYSKKDLI